MTVVHSFSSSVVLVTSKGRLVTRGAWTKALETLGADKGIKLKGNCNYSISVGVL